MSQALVVAGSNTALELIGGSFAIDFGHQLLETTPGQTVYAIRNRGVGRSLMAVQAVPGLPPRARALTALLPSPVPGMLCPLAHGPATLPMGGEAYFVVCDAPAGPSLAAAGRTWYEHELVECVLRPAAAVLEALAARNVTHRAIRADNVFQTLPGEAVVLGEAWSRPGAWGQPALYEPPYIAACLDAGRGEGCIADDVYALGVLMLVLALRTDPFEGLSPDAIVRRKLDLGSYAAIVGDRRLPSAITELARGMLADDPEHRPSPALLGNPAAARARRVATRPPRRAQRPIDFEGEAIWNTRVLAHAIGRSTQAGAVLVRSGAVGQWVRRSIGDTALTARIDEAERVRLAGAGTDAHEDALLLVRTTATLDSLAPLYWPGFVVWPDGISTALAHGQTDSPIIATALEDAIKADALSVWAGTRAERCAAPVIKTESRRWRTILTGPNEAFSRLRLLYALNPLHGCASPLLAGHMVTRPIELLRALENVAVHNAGPIDLHIAAFLAGRRDDKCCSEIPEPAALPSVDTDPFAQLRLLARLQASLNPTLLPSLAVWLADVVAPALNRFHSQARRVRLELQMRKAAASGNLASMVVCLDQTAEQFNDRAGWLAAQARIQEIDNTLAGLMTGRPARNAVAKSLSAEISGGAGLLAAGTAVVMALLG